MATLNFDESIVLVLFAQSDGSTTPSRADIVQFDAELQSTYGASLQRIMTEEELPIDVHSCSLVLGCRPDMPGNTSASQIRSACRYILSARRALGEAVEPSSVAFEGAKRPATTRAGSPSRRRKTGSRKVSSRGKRSERDLPLRGRK